MTDCGENGKVFDGDAIAYRRVLVVVMVINGSMFAVEMAAGAASQSLALWADALDFLGDTATYAISLYVLGKALRVRALAALAKGIGLGLMGTWVLGSTIYNIFVLGTPNAAIMGSVGIIAFVANALSAVLLLRFRNGDANVRSVWLCSRNDAIGNLAVILAASGVWAVGSGWPDLMVAGVMASLFLHSSTSIIRHALKEIRSGTEAIQD